MSVEPNDTSTQSEELKKNDSNEDNLEPALDFDVFCDKLSGLIYGCLLGETYARLKTKVVTGNLEKWAFTTEQLLLMMKTIINVGQFSPRSYIRLLQDYISLGGDVDTYTKSVIMHQKALLNPVDTAFIIKDENEKKNNQTDHNTALIRCILAGIFDNWDQLSYQTSMTTHADHRCISAGIIYTVVSHCMFIGHNTNVMRSVIETAECILQLQKIEKQSHINEYIRYTSESYINNLELISLGTGESTAYKTMCSSMYSLNKLCKNKSKESFYQRLDELINADGDVAVNCALAGALMGCELGYNALDIDETKELIEIEEEHMIKFKEIEADFFKQLGFARVDETMPENCHNRGGWRLVYTHEIKQQINTNENHSEDKKKTNKIRQNTATAEPITEPTDEHATDEIKIRQDVVTDEPVTEPTDEPVTDEIKIRQDDATDEPATESVRHGN